MKPNSELFHSKYRPRQLRAQSNTNVTNYYKSIELINVIS